MLHVPPRPRHTFEHLFGHGWSAHHRQVRAHEEKAARERLEIGYRIEAGAKALRRWGSSLQHADQARHAYATYAIAAVFDTLALRPERFPSTAVNDALRACQYLLEPLPGDQADRRSASSLDES